MLLMPKFKYSVWLSASIFLFPSIVVADVPPSVTGASPVSAATTESALLNEYAVPTTATAVAVTDPVVKEAATAVAFADDDTGIALPATVDTVVVRTRWIQKQLDDRKSYAAWWKYGFMGLFGATTVIQGVSYYVVDDQELKNDALVGTIMSALGVGGMVISPVDGGGVATELRDYRSVVTDAVAELAYAERLLYETYLDEQEGRHWFQYAQMLIASGTSAGVMYFHYDQPTSAVLKFVSGVGASTARILLTPTQATEAWHAYQRRFTPAVEGAYRVEPIWGVDVYPQAIALRVNF